MTEKDKLIYMNSVKAKMFDTIRSYAVANGASAEELLSLVMSANMSCTFMEDSLEEV